jgi:hypothetical protein
MRILIPKGSHRDVERGGAYGIQMRDGTTYDADRKGYIDVTNPAHLDQIRKNPVMRDVGLRVDQVDFRLTVDENVCPSCGFSGFRWQRTCPKDGTELELT